MRRVDLLLGALGDVDELHRDASADLLGQRAREALQGALRGRVARRCGPLGGGAAGGRLRRGAQHDDPASGTAPV